MADKWKCDVCGRTGGSDEIYNHLRKDHKYPEEDANLCCIRVVANKDRIRLLNFFSDLEGHDSRLALVEELMNTMSDDQLEQVVESLKGRFTSYKMRSK